jgi:hypothetical protein
MLCKALSAAVYGIDASIIEVEVDVSGIRCDKDNFMTVGLPDAAVRESRERIRSALRNCGYDIPPTHITVNLGRLRRNLAQGSAGSRFCGRTLARWRGARSTRRAAHSHQ